MPMAHHPIRPCSIERGGWMRALTKRRGGYKSETSRPGALTNNCFDVYIRWHNTSGSTACDKSTTWTRVSMSTSGSTVHPVAQHATSLQHRRLIFNENSETTHTHGLCTRTGPTSFFVLARKSACLFVCTSLYHLSVCLSIVSPYLSFCLGLWPFDSPRRVCFAGCFHEHICRTSLGVYLCIHV